MIRIVFSKVTYTTFKRQVLLFLIILDVFFLWVENEGSFRGGEEDLKRGGRSLLM